MTAAITASVPPPSVDQPPDQPNESTAAVPLLGRSVESLTEWVTQHGQPAYRGKQLHQWIYQKGIRSLDEVTVFSKQWRAEVKDFPVGRSQLHSRSESPDGTIKYLLKLKDGLILEAVGIPSDKRLTVCVSSQIGCPMGCDFCATGKGGFTRNLETYEIVDQVLTVQEDFQRRVSNIVFMGMGEPLLNTDAVVGAVRSLNQDVCLKKYIPIAQKCEFSPTELIRSAAPEPGTLVIDRTVSRHFQSTSS